MGEPIVKIQNLSFTYPLGERKALDDINLEINKGEFIVVMGPNGAGKTTLCLTLNGIIPSVINGTYEGKVFVGGMQTTKHRVYELAQKVGVTLQDPESQFIAPTVKSEVIFGPENLGVSREDILRRLKYALNVTRLEGKEEASPVQLSGGQKQRCALACGIAMLSEVLVLDEPTSQLDPIGTAEIFSVVKDLNKKHGVTVIMTEHKSEETAEFADRVILLNEGHILADGNPHKVFQEEEAFNKVNVKLPQVCQLAHRVGRHVKLSEFPVNSEEGRAVFSKLFEEKAISTKKDYRRVRAEKTESDKVVLEAIDLWHVYPPDITALRNVNIKIYDGEFVGIIGQNGAGKTTLVKHFVGLLKPTKGKVFVFGEDTTRKRPAEICRQIGLVLQNPDHQIFNMTVEEEVSFGPKNLGLTPKEVSARVDEAINLMGLEKFRNVYPFRLSFGDRRKLSVAAIYAMRPKIFILDEPTTGQDYKGRYEICEVAKRLNEMGNTVLMITHDMELVANYTTRTLVLGNGEIIKDGPTHKVFSQQEILRMTYLKPPQITQLAQSFRGYGVPPDLITVDEFSQAISYGK